MANTAAPLSETGIANMAANVLEDTRVTSLDDNTPIARFVSSEFGYVRDELLRTYPWAFAKKVARLPPKNDAPLFNYSYAYQLPSDCIRLLPLRPSGYHNATTKPSYELVGREVHTSAGGEVGGLPIMYIRRVLNAAEFDPLFARAMGCRLALMAAQRITGKASYFDRAVGLFKEAMASAVLVDSLEGGTPEDQYRFDLENVRAPGL